MSPTSNLILIFFLKSRRLWSGCRNQRPKRKRRVEKIPPTHSRLVNLNISRQRNVKRFFHFSLISSNIKFLPKHSNQFLVQYASNYITKYPHTQKARESITMFFSRLLSNCLRPHCDVNRCAPIKKSL